MSSGHYHKRWSASTNGRTTPTSVSLSSAVEPSTYGTSWNSVRWNKPSTGYRSQSSSIAARFEKPSYTSPSPARGTSRFSTGKTYGSGISDAAKTAASLSSLGPSVSSRASRFDSTIRDNKEKYRTEARELINKWTSRERPTADNSYSNSYSRKPFETSSYKSKSSDFPYRKSASMTPTRTTIPSVARYSSLDRTSTGLLSPSPTPQSQWYSMPTFSPTPKMERPWRQRMAEASRIRATHGDEVSASYAAARRDNSSRRGSLSQASGDELGSCLGTIRNYLSNSGYTSRDTGSSVYGPSSRFSTSAASPYRKEETPSTPTVSKYMSRSYSPVRSPLDVFKTSSASKVSSVAPPEKTSRPSSRESIREERKESHVSAVPKNPTIRESSKERENERKKSASIKDRTARRNSRQRSQQESSSSGDEDREEARRRRRRRRNDTTDGGSLPPTTNGSMASQAKTMENKGENGKSPSLASAAVLPAIGGTGATCLLVNASEDDFQSCAESPRMGQKVSRNNSGTRLPSKSQIIKSPSVVEVPGISKSDSRPDVTAPSPSIAPSVAESTSIHLFQSNSLDNIDELVYDSEDNSSVQGDESQYSAVAHFKPYKMKVKPIAPVPGLWQKPGEPVCISKNKAFVKEEEHKTAFIIMKVKRKERVSKKIVKKKPLATKNGEEKKEQKITQDSPVKKLFLGRKKVIKPEDENEEDEKKPQPVEAMAKDTPKEEKAKPKAVPEKSKVEMKEKAKPVEVKEKPKVAKEVEIPKVAPPAKAPAAAAVSKDAQKIPEAKKEAPKEVAKPKEVHKPKEEKPKEDPVEKMKETPKEIKEVPKIQPPKPQPPKEETATATATFTKKPAPTQRATGVRKDKARLSLAKKYKAIGRPAAAAVDKTFSRKAVELKAQKNSKTRPNIRVSHKLKCESSTNVTVTVSSDLIHQEMPSFGAQVIVDRPQKGVNAARVKLRCRQPQNRQSTPSHSELAQKGEKLAAEFEKAKLRVLQEEPMRSPSRESQSKAAEMLDEMRNTEPALEWRRRDSGGQLILPDKSVLEEYVKRKRGRLERLHLEPLRDREEQCDSPCNSTTSELLPACAVRVFGASPREIPVITAPSRTSSVETPTAMLDSIQSIPFNNFNSTPQAFLRNNTARLQFSKPIQFDTPKTPFEERMQQQANAIRKASVCSTQDGSEIGDTGRRLSQQGDGMSISSAFTAAMAEKAGQNRHERYAAHIPVNRGETSGRQSAASVDSTHSGALDAASKQLDQVIDQARHRHHQHRSKFKEAIDYLDQIFEDLKKECDVNGEDKNNNSDTVTATVNVVPKEIKRPTVIQPSSSQPLKTNSLPDRAQRHQRALVQTQQSPVELTVGKKSSANNTPPETTVTETIVLPRKTDKLDFTRRWLQDDLSSLAHQPAPIAMFPEQCMYTDADEHSLGSCSAEVAAINAGGRKEEQKKSSTTTVPKIVTQPAPIRPQPQRPMPLHSHPGSSNGSRHFPVEYDGLQRVQSFDHVQADRRENSAWRAGSQEPYQTLGSIRSDTDNLRPSPSAFTNVNMFPQRGGMRGSLRSLPDANIVRGSKMTSPRDPVLAIDQLVAELELNTEQPTTAADKRRSFPTSLRTEASEPSRTGSERQGSRGRHNGYGGQRDHFQQQQSYPAQQIRHQRQQRSLDEAANMLQNVVGDLGMSQQKHKKQGAAQFLGQQSNPFETINQEKINPSRVEAMHNMFERGGGANKSWRSPQPYQQPVPQPYKPPKEEELIYDLADYAVKAYMRVSPPRQVQTVRQSPLNTSQEFTPAYPLSQPPQHPPGRNGSANSSTNGGYYSSNSSTAGPSQPAAHRSSLIGRQSLVSSRGPSVDDEDDGFYDNIGVFDDRRFSRGSEMDVASISSRPPANSQKHTRIGSFFRKIGGSSRPPGSAASLISLNKVANEAPIRSGVLMKSNSLSNEPWKKEVLQQSMPREATASKASLGSRLKNSLFGSKKRLNG